MDRLEPALHTHGLARACTHTRTRDILGSHTHETYADATDARAATRLSACRPVGRSGLPSGRGLLRE